ncbi:Frag1/DRAM/Sfk1 family-domain-containing protein [Parachaetomium inaequale]|uniref:Frag1/DRAM/Sfk1 family-domain-containing protein n=1 Tax=Parachaetomium inaequale TaxID=2588326 RepID=A0AAN6SW38_9PEZI|nr:Frag1/DRAM/Sfk1 family-domain-containing protein [Parachaetomium inaequale]
MVRLSYWVTPILAGTVWLATLLALLLYWIVSEGRTHYPSMSESQTIAYISDVGASTLKPLFITGCVLTTVLLDISFGADRWLRHKGRLAPNTTTTEKVLSGLTIVFAVLGTAGLILLSYREHRVLRISFWIKLTFVIVEVLLAVAFVACTFTRHYNPGAVLEWIIAFIFSAYVFSFYVDLYPAAATKHQVPPGGSHGMGVGMDGEGLPKMRLTRGRETPMGRGSRYEGAGEMEEGEGSEGTLVGGGVASFEAARVAHGRRSGSRSRVMASNF